MVGMGGEPLVDDLLHDDRPAHRAADRRTRPLGAHVLHEPRVGRVARLCLGDLGLDPLRRDLDALRVGDAGEHEEGLHPLLGVRAHLRVDLGLGLADRLEVDLLRDPLPYECALHLVVHDLDLLVHEDFGRVDGPVGDGVLDDPVGELVARAVERVPLQTLADLRPQGVQVGVVADGAGELVVRVGCDLLAELLHGHREVRVLPGEVRLGIVRREGDVELLRLTDRGADDVVLESGDEPAVAHDHGGAVGRPALERDAVAGADEADDRVVALADGPVLDRVEPGLLVTELVHDLVDLLVVDRLDLRREREAPVVAEGDLGRDGDGRLEQDRLPLLGLHDLDRGAGERDDGRLDDRLAIRVLDEPLHGVVEDRAIAEHALEHRARGLAGAEPGDARAAREAADGLGDLAVEAVGRDLHFEEDGAVGCGGGGDIHRRAMIAAGTPSQGAGRGAAGRGRHGAASAGDAQSVASAAARSDQRSSAGSRPTCSRMSSPPAHGRTERFIPAHRSGMTSDSKPPHE